MNPDQNAGAARRPGGAASPNALLAASATRPHLTLICHPAASDTRPTGSPAAPGGC